MNYLFGINNNNSTLVNEKTRNYDSYGKYGLDNDYTSTPVYNIDTPINNINLTPVYNIDTPIYNNTTPVYNIDTDGVNRSLPTGYPGKFTADENYAANSNINSDLYNRDGYTLNRLGFRGRTGATNNGVTGSSNGVYGSNNGVTGSNNGYNFERGSGLNRSSNGFNGSSDGVSGSINGYSFGDRGFNGGRNDGLDISRNTSERNRFRGTVDSGLFELNGERVKRSADSGYNGVNGANTGYNGVNGADGGFNSMNGADSGLFEVNRDFGRKIINSGHHNSFNRGLSKLKNQYGADSRFGGEKGLNGADIGFERGFNDRSYNHLNQDLGGSCNLSRDTNKDPNGIYRDLNIGHAGSSNSTSNNGYYAGRNETNENTYNIDNIGKYNFNYKSKNHHNIDNGLNSNYVETGSNNDRQRDIRNRLDNKVRVDYVSGTKSKQFNNNPSYLRTNENKSPGTNQGYKNSLFNISDEGVKNSYSHFKSRDKSSENNNFTAQRYNDRSDTNYSSRSKFDDEIRRDGYRDSGDSKSVNSTNAVKDDYKRVKDPNDKVNGKDQSVYKKGTNSADSKSFKHELHNSIGDNHPADIDNATFTNEFASNNPPKKEGLYPNDVGSTSYLKPNKEGDTISKAKGKLESFTNGFKSYFDKSKNSNISGHSDQGNATSSTHSVHFKKIKDYELDLRITNERFANLTCLIPDDIDRVIQEQKFAEIPTYEPIEFDYDGLIARVDNNIRVLTKIDQSLNVSTKDSLLDKYDNLKDLYLTSTKKWEGFADDYVKLNEELKEMNSKLTQKSRPTTKIKESIRKLRMKANDDSLKKVCDEMLQLCDDIIKIN